MGNEKADALAKTGAENKERNVIQNKNPLTYEEYHTKMKQEITKKWHESISSEWYVKKTPGAILKTSMPRKYATSITRLKTGHTLGMTFIDGKKTFKTCTKCSIAESSPQHIIDCFRLSKNDIYDNMENSATVIFEKFPEMLKMV